MKAKKQASSRTKKPIQVAGRTLPKKIAGVETRKVLTAGATIVGAAAVAAAGYFLWKRRDQIMGFVEDVQDKISSRFSKEEHEAQYPFGKEEEYYASAREQSSRV